LHHIHHLNSLIPNYRLQECLAASPEFMALNRLSLMESFKCANLSLWDEERRELVTFADASRA
jgi:omega-6 fatty acid desaturase (delta-12 desaturase)